MKYYKTSNDKLTLRQSTQPVCTTCKLYTSKAAIAWLQWDWTVSELTSDKISGCIKLAADRDHSYQ